MLQHRARRSALLSALAGAAALALLVHVVTLSSGPALLEEEEEMMMDDEPVVSSTPEVSEDSYTALHPVYGRCRQQVKMHDFVQTIQRTCGNIHELNEVENHPAPFFFSSKLVAGPCRQAMWQASDNFGCCWETIMDGYQQLYPTAYHAWRNWQGTLSGKAGVTFETQSCGAPMGSKSFSDLESKVSGLQDTVQDQNQEIQYLESMLFYGGMFKGKGAAALRQQRVRAATQPRLQ